MRKVRGFTLVELLVVIGIIALLISIIIPVLGGVRRQANSVKCQASLRQIGSAVMLYANEFDGKLPVAIHEVNTTPGVRLPINEQRRWYDLIAKYIAAKGLVEATTDIDKIRENSVVWGCPEWGRSVEFIYSNDSLRPGYGMSYYTRKFFKSTSLSQALLNEMTYITTDRARGSYVSLRQYAGKETASTGLIADSMTHIIAVPGAASLANVSFSSVRTGGWQPGPVGTESSLYTNGGLAFYIDPSRHGKRNVRVKETDRTINMLFLDGHVDTVSVREAWTAITGKSPF